MAGIRTFQAVLQETILPSDSKWEYVIPNLPHAGEADASHVVKSIAFISSSKEQIVRLRMVPAPTNRVINTEPLHNFLLLSFEDFRLRLTAKTEDGQSQFATAKESADYIALLLKTGIALNDTYYHFFGHSNSQLRSRSCFMFAAKKEEISAKVGALGDFSKMQSVGKKAKRLGLLFSSADAAVDVPADRCEDIEDITEGDYIFTDGCGLIASQLASRIAQRRRIMFRNKRYLPSVFQIRYRGYKGVLMIEPSLKQKTQILFRRSMKKLSDVQDLSLSIVEYSKPYTFGYLNDEVAVLLHTLNVSADVLHRKQNDHLEFLQQAYIGEPRAAFQFLSYQNESTLAEKLLIEGVDATRNQLRKLVRQEFLKMLNKRDEQRCRIMIPQSRLLFGVCDPSGRDGTASKLSPGTCFVRVTLDGDGEARTLINTEVMVTRNPCLHPGDIQKFRAVDVPEFSHPVDCIVFPTRGERPSADLMSGGDLDGDKFFVTWDPDIILRTIAYAAVYPGVKEKIRFGSISDDDRAEFFARYNNMSLGKVKNLYLKWARLKGAMCAECQQLNRLFSQCVDGNRIRTPPVLEDPPEAATDAPAFILDMLHQASSATIHKILAGPMGHESLDLDIVGLISCRDQLAISEFELIQLALRSCEKEGHTFRDLVELFNFSALSDEERAWLLDRLPPTQDMPGLVLNGLLQSDLVRIDEIRTFELHHPRLHWKPVFKSSMDRMERFLRSIARTLQLFHKKLIILQADERLTLMIYIPHRIETAEEKQVGSSVRVFALPRSSGTSSAHYRVIPTNITSKIYCDDNVFQLYEMKRGNTFVFLTRGQVDNSSCKGMKNKTEQRSQKQRNLDDRLNFDCRASVALNKISVQVQKHVGRMNRAGILSAVSVEMQTIESIGHTDIRRIQEIYVISNRDVESMRYLDQWLEYIDTDEKMPLFEPIEQAYDAPALSDHDRDFYPRAVVNVVWNHDLCALEQLSSTDELNQVLHVLSGTGQKSRLLALYKHMLSIEFQQRYAQDSLATLGTLLEFLIEAPFLAETFLKSETYRSHSNDLAEQAASIFPELLGQLVLSAHMLPAFVKRPFETILIELKQLSMQQMGNLCELVALCVSEPQFGLDLLVEALEPAASKVLLGRPREISQAINQLIGIALNHIDEANASRRLAEHALKLELNSMSESDTVLKANIRIDSTHATMRVGDHIRFVASQAPKNAPFQQAFVMDTLVISSQPGTVRFRCLHRPPIYVAACAWKYRHCGSFVTSKVMFDAVTAFYGLKTASCKLYYQLTGLSSTEIVSSGAATRATDKDASLNESQNKALNAAMHNTLLLLWGPPGTGKTHTIVVILKRLLDAYVKSRILVTAPTHNAVDNILHRFLKVYSSKALAYKPLRVATNLSRVAPALREYTCDAFVGKDLSDSFSGRRKAQERVKQSRLVFTTCIGAGLGLLREEEFDIVLVDEASQQTEPETLVPLVKCCRRAILVGDHVQLRATVQKHALLTGFDVSLFERHYTTLDLPGVAKVMLDVQYRMHPDICRFSSKEFYQDRLKSFTGGEKIAIPRSQFPWPENGARMVFVQCNDLEDLGRQSKSNHGQVRECVEICKRLATSNVEAKKPNTSSSSSSSIAILTPYTRQRQLLEKALPSYTVSSIDGFQGREADIIVFVTVRSNMHYETGFLKDMRRLNVAMTRARAGVIIIGDRATLIGRAEDGADLESKSVWRRLLESCAAVEIVQNNAA